ncbi:oligogalacturonate-specific porin KdgM family protein [Vibrio tapetis subsp. quintayensis]|uniref:oligogalacturonate-specific porin KdgM family protein n=1 Tax=Vibrio tapetis TaxID=52443 RepID=UPI0025B402CC|nr:oligogalacturonate-specific porin KdgM family protein [Vibrio tapetis]MDN3682605.1 oligogalacturonate-specific porin KdgM family protein [Vibrio tapetis subsp. quintayensis]
MKKVFALTALAAVFSTSAFAGSSYVTGNVQFHSENKNPNATSTLEAGHTFDTGTTILTEFDGISLGSYEGAFEEGKGATPYITLGVEQSYSFNDNLWVAVGYHHLLNNGETVQNRPLAKIGYNFDNGIAISNRTRYHNIKEGDNNQWRFDNRIGYAVNADVAVAYNNVYVSNTESGVKNTMDHEMRATWTREGVQPYFELRSQGHGGEGNVNNAFVFGASYGF